MTFPVWITVGPWRLHPHTVFELLAYASGFALYLSLRRRRGDAISDGHRWSVLTATIVGAAVGSRLLAWFEGAAIFTLFDPCVAPDDHYDLDS